MTQCINMHIVGPEYTATLAGLVYFRYLRSMESQCWPLWSCETTRHLWCLYMYFGDIKWSH